MTWQGLTEDEIVRSNTDFACMGARAYRAGVEWAEKKLKEKNEKNCTGHRDEHGSRYDPFVRNSGH